MEVELFNLIDQYPFWGISIKLLLTESSIHKHDKDVDTNNEENTILKRFFLTCL